MPARLVIAPEVPTMWVRSPANSAFSAGSSMPPAVIDAPMSATMASYQGSPPPSGSGWRSARLTTPNGADIHAAALQPSPFRVSQDISVEPPPTSITSTASAVGSIRFRQPSTASLASSAGSMMRSDRPVPRRTRSTNASPFSAARQAWVATADKRPVSTPFRAMRSAHRARAS